MGLAEDAEVEVVSALGLREPHVSLSACICIQPYLLPAAQECERPDAWLLAALWVPRDEEGEESERL